MDWLPNEVKIYRAMLLAYPAEFRHEYAAEMERLFEERLRREPHVRVWLDAIADLVLTAAKEHLHTLGGDLRHGARVFARAPGVTLIALLAMALGVGATTAVFSVINAVLIRSLPYGSADRLVYMWTPNPRLEGVPREMSPVWADFFAWRAASRSFTEIAGFSQFAANLGGGGSAVRIAGARVTGNFFRTLQAFPELGRAVDERDDEPGGPGVAVISHRLWISRFGGETAALGKTIPLGGRDLQVIGVMPREFAYPHDIDFPYAFNDDLRNTDVWVPAALSGEEAAGRETGPSAALGRLRPGVTLERAQAEMSAIEKRLDPLNPAEFRGFQSLLVPFVETALGPVRPLLWVLLGAVVLVLLIAASNVASLLLARSVDRTHEMGVRTAMGADRARLVRQMLTEAALLGVSGGAAGILAAFAILRAITRFNPGDIPRLEEASLDGRVLMFTLGVSLLAGLLAGVAPARFTSRVRVSELLRQGGGRGLVGGPARLRNVLVVTEVALSVTLLAGAGLLIRSYLNVLNQDKGYSAATLTMKLASERSGRTQQQTAALFKDLSQRIRALPGVESAGAIDRLPLSHGESLTFMEAEGYANRSGQTVRGRAVSGDYFGAMGMRLIEGRFLTDGDMDGQSHAVVVSQSLGNRYFAGRSAVGRRIRLGGPDPNAPWSIIVGVVADVRHTDLEQAPQPIAYGPSWTAGEYAIRSNLPGDAMAASLRQVLRSVDSTIALADIQTMDHRISQAGSARRFQTVLLAAFAAIAVVLALAGLYGLLSYSVRQRAGEIGLRMALGASRADVVGMVVRQGLTLVALGLAVGLAAAMALSGAIAKWLYGVGAGDPATLAAVPVFILLVGALACAIPAWKAAKVDPATALRLTS